MANTQEVNLYFTLDTKYPDIELNIDSTALLDNYELKVEPYRGEPLVLNQDNLGILELMDKIYIVGDRLKPLKEGKFESFLYADINGVRSLLTSFILVISEGEALIPPQVNQTIVIEDILVNLSIDQSLNVWEGLKGEDFEYSDFTPEQLALLKGDKGDKGEKGDSGGIQSVVAGENITIDNTDPLNPIISAEEGGTTITKTSDLTNDGEDGVNPFITAQDIPVFVESLTSIQQPTLTGNILTIKYTGENGVIQSQNVDLSNLITSDVTIVDANYDASTNIITLLDSNGDDYKVDLSEFSILTTTDVNGVTNLNQEGVTKLTVSRVGQTGDYNHLLNRPNMIESVNFEIVDGELIVQDVAGVSVILVDNELIIN